MTFSGPMFERDSQHFASEFKRNGAHYNIYRILGVDIAALKAMWPDGEANELNFCLFSTSGVHGMYTTLEEIEARLKNGEDDDEYRPEVTVLIVHPRIVCLRYGNIRVTLDDLPYLKRLRGTSWAAVQKIGREEDPVERL